jgi:hypothetical protein
MTTITFTPSRTFPAEATSAALRAELLASVVATAGMHGMALPPTPGEQCAAPVQLDSLDVVAMLCKLEPIVGITLKDSLVKSGGYRSVDEAMSHLIPRIQAAWDKSVTKGKKK